MKEMLYVTNGKIELGRLVAFAAALLGKESDMRNLLHTASVIFAIILIMAAGFWLGDFYRATRIPHLRDFQRLIGCEKIDCKVGPSWKDSETQAKWQTAYLNQHGVLMY